MDVDLKDEESFLDRRAVGLRDTPISSVAEFHTPNDVTFDYDLLEDLRQQGIDWISWVPVEKIYQNLTQYGRPSAVYPAYSYLAVGTSKGVVTIFNHKQFLQMALLLDDDFAGSKVTMIRSSVDGTHIAASLESGDIFIWNLNQKTRESSNRVGPREIAPILHITEHKYKHITGLGFLAERHTAVVVSDDSGVLSCHNGFRKGIWHLSYSTIDLNNRSPNQHSVVATASYPGFSNAPFSDLQPVAVLSERSLDLVSANSFELCYHTKVEENISTNSSVVWSACGLKLCYFGSHHLEVICFLLLKSTQKLVNSSKVSWSCEEIIKCVEWLSSSYLGILTQSNKYIFISASNGTQQFETIDMLPIALLSPVACPVVYFNRQIYALTNYNLQTGYILSWSDIILKFVQSGAYISALRSIRYFVAEEGLPFNLLRLEDDVTARKKQLEQPLKNVSIASVRHIVRAQGTICDESVLYQVIEESLYTYYLVFRDQTIALDFVELALEQIPDECTDAFFSCLISLIQKNTIRSLSPVVFSQLLRSNYIGKNPVLMKHLLFNLDISSMDVDNAVDLCKKLKFGRELIYLWTVASSDYLTPFVEMLSIIASCGHRTYLLTEELCRDKLLIYDYLAFVMTGRQFPLQCPIQPPSLRFKVKVELCHILFNGTLIDWPPESNHKLYTCADQKDEPAFPYLELLLNFDLKTCLGMLNEILEDSIFDIGFNEVQSWGDDTASRSSVSRQFVMDFMIDKLKLLLPLHEKVLTAIFIVRNLSKYPQFIRLSTSVIDDLATLLCTGHTQQVWSESEKALEALITGGYVSDPKNLIPHLKSGKFERVLLLVYKHIGAFSQFLALRLVSQAVNSAHNSVLDAIRFCLESTRNRPTERSAVLEVIANKIDAVLSVDVAAFIACLDKYDATFHFTVFKRASYSSRCLFLHQYFLFHNPTSSWEFEMMSQYVLDLEGSQNESGLRELFERTHLPMKEYERLLKKLRDSNSMYGALLVERQMRNLEGVVEDFIKLSESCQNDLRCNELLDYAFEACKAAEGEQARNCWTRLLTYLLRERSDQYQVAIKQLFNELTKATDENFGNAPAFSVKEVVTGALENPDLILTKMKDLAPTFCEIMNSADINGSLLSAISSIIYHSSADELSYYEKLLQSGWSIGTSDCDICGEKLWGLNVSSDAFLAWKQKSLSKKSAVSVHRQTPKLCIVLFDCNHGFHEDCLNNLGQDSQTFRCFFCEN
ncbi:LAFA_0E07580g1_1 [Lachancea sp. 'fantastica']|nr:LAFA_0E07580g1_1 [Lachancea sp. 'fantastica']